MDEKRARPITRPPAMTELPIEGAIPHDMPWDERVRRAGDMANRAMLYLADPPPHIAEMIAVQNASDGLLMATSEIVEIQRELTSRRQRATAVRWFAVRYFGSTDCRGNELNPKEERRCAEKGLSFKECCGPCALLWFATDIETRSGFIAPEDRIA